MLTLKNLSSSESPLLIAKIAFCAFYPLWTLSFLGFFISWAYKYWNRPTKFNTSLARNSYNMYLVHYVVPFLFPLMLSPISMPTFIKFLIISVVTLLFSYGFSALMMQPLSRVIKSNGVRANRP
jgi:hypothetical protein